MRLTNEVLAGLETAAHDGQPDACGGLHLIPFHIERRGEPRAYALGNAPGIRGPDGVVEENREFVSAEPRDDVLHPDGLDEPACDRDQQGIRPITSEAIVHHAEPVQVQKHDREARLASPPSRHGLLELDPEERLVRQRGELVAEPSLREASLGGLALRDLSAEGSVRRRELGGTPSYARLQLGLGALQGRLVLTKSDEHGDLGEQRIGAERLRQIVDGTEGVAAQRIVLLGRCGEKDDGNAARQLAMLQLLHGLEAVQARHPDVQEDHRAAFALDGFERLRARRRADDALPERLEDGLEREQVLATVVDDEDPYLRQREGWLPHVRLVDAFYGLT